jgi:hypothetical protein
MNWHNMITEVFNTNKQNINPKQKQASLLKTKKKLRHPFQRCRDNAIRARRSGHMQP